MTTPVVVTSKIHFSIGRCGRRFIDRGEKREKRKPGRIPWVSKLMALAIRLEGLVRDGTVKDQADLARLGKVTRARTTQIMNLLLLAPDIQEKVLFLLLTERGKDSIMEQHLRPIVAQPDWREQRRMWKELARQRLATSTDVP